MNNTDVEVTLLACGVAFILAVLLMVGIAKFVNGFSRELKYINNEISRNRGSERQYWIKKRRRLWLSLIPFVKY